MLPRSALTNAPSLLLPSLLVLVPLSAKPAQYPPNIRPRPQSACAPPQVQFRTRVEKVFRCPATLKWHLSLRRGVYTCPHRAIFLLGRGHGEHAAAA